MNWIAIAWLLTVQEDALSRAADGMNEAADNVQAIAGVDIAIPRDRAWAIEMKSRPDRQKLWITVSRSKEFRTELQARDILTQKSGSIWFRKIEFGKVKNGPMMLRQRVDCQNITMTLLQIISYKLDGEVAFNIEYTPAQLKANAVVPNSSGEKILEAVCG